MWRPWKSKIVEDNKESSKWASDFIVEEDFQVLNKEKLDFVLSETEKVLSKTLENSETLENKSYIILGILFAIISGLIKFFVDHFGFKVGIGDQDWALLAPVLAWVGSYLVASVLLIRSIKPAEYQAVGNEPENLLLKSVLSYDLVRILVSEIENRQGYIDGNERNNRIKAQYIIRSLEIIFWTPPLSLMLMLLLRYMESIQVLICFLGWHR
jgi:hypothetical protein